jgi:hypothetical protein
MLRFLHGFSFFTQAQQNQITKTPWSHPNHINERSRQRTNQYYHSYIDGVESGCVRCGVWEQRTIATSICQDAFIEFGLRDVAGPRERSRSTVAPDTIPEMLIAAKYGGNNNERTLSTRLKS